MGGPGLWIRWAWRDLRARLGLIVTIACVLAFGVGLSASFGSLADWMLRSFNASYATSNTHDVHVRLASGSFVSNGALRDALRVVAHPEQVVAAEERLIVPTQLEVPAFSGHPTTLVPASLVGVDVSDGGPHVDTLSAQSGRVIGSADIDTGQVMVAHDFAKNHGIVPGTTSRLTGDHAITVVGTGTNPSYFVGSSGDSGLVVTLDIATVFAPLETVRDVAGIGSVSNDLIVKLTPGTDPNAFRRDLSAALGTRLPQASVTIETLAEEPGHLLLYGKATQAQQIYSLIAWLVLLGAAIATFNLANRVVAAQRREIGVGMALGVPTRWLALRPLLLAGELAVLGTIVGVAVAWGFTAILQPVLAQLMTLPAWRTPVIWSQFASAAVIGLTLPFVAVVWPVWRAVHRSPAEVVRTGAHDVGTAPSRAFAALAERMPWPRTALGRMPLRDLARAPRRTLLTALGIAAAITVLVGMYGMIDGFTGAIDQVGANATNRTPNRVLVSLNRYLPENSSTIRSITKDRTVAAAEPIAIVGAVARPQGRTDAAQATNLAITLAEPDGLWAPKIAAGTDFGDGIVLSRGAAAHLGVGVGDTISLEHPVRTGTTTFATASSDVRVIGLSDDGMRAAAMMQRSQAAKLFGLDRYANAVQVAPAPGVGAETVAESLFGVSGIVSVQPANAMTQAFHDYIAQDYAILQVAAASIVLLAFGLAYNSARLAVEERRRYHATMFAFGVPVHRVESDLVVESCIIGVLGTLLGILGGYAFLAYVVGVAMPAIMPEIVMGVSLSLRTIGLALVLGIVAVAVAPLLSWRRLRHIDICGELRVIE